MKVRTAFNLLTLIGFAAAAAAGGAGAYVLIDAARRTSPGAALPDLARHAWPTLRIVAVVTAAAAVIALATGLVLGQSIARRLAAVRNLIVGPTPAAGDDLDHIGHALADQADKIKTLRARQTSDEQLLAARRFADNVIHSMFDLLIVTDADLRIVTVNRAA